MINSLPADIIFEIITFLDEISLRKVSQVTAEWNRLSNKLFQIKCKHHPLKHIFEQVPESTTNWAKIWNALQIYPSSIRSSPRWYTTKEKTYLIFKSLSSSTTAALADKPFTPKLAELLQINILYFEIKLVTYPEVDNRAVGIALTEENFPEDTFPGWMYRANSVLSIAYHADDGKKRFTSDYGTAYAEGSTEGDTIGLGWDIKQNSIFFTKNGKNLGLAEKNFPVKLWYPAIGSNINATCHINMGTQPFVYDIKNSKEWYLTAPTPQEPELSASESGTVTISDDDEEYLSE